MSPPIRRSLLDHEPESIRLWATRAADARAVAARRGGGRPGPPDVPVLRQPDRPGGSRVPRDERALVTGLSDPDVPPALAERPSSRSSGLLPRSSNYTFLARARAEGGRRRCSVVYKPRRGELPLWDFPEGTLCQREVAAYVVARALGWPRVPPDRPARRARRASGPCSASWRSIPRPHYFTLEPERADGRSATSRCSTSWSTTPTARPVTACSARTATICRDRSRRVLPRGATSCAP